MTKNRTNEIMKKHTEILEKEGEVKVSFDKDTLTLTIRLNKEIIKYHRHRHSKFATYDPMKKYKEILKEKISKALEESNIDITEYKDYPVSYKGNYYKVPSKSNSLITIALMLQNTIKRTVTPDVDNFDKTAFDVLNGLIWTDDKQVFLDTSSKLWDSVEGTTMQITFHKPYEIKPRTRIESLVKDGIISEYTCYMAKKIKKDRNEDDDIN